MSLPTDIKPPWIEFDIMVRIVRRRLNRSVRHYIKNYKGVERIKPAIEKQIELFSFYRTNYHPNLLWRV
ncbi:MAG: hypothetical protein DRJ38_07850 [Thermoprotei archaeon]|nr:MAG: hypothetical protein DRJ38_07850 [Thermoprotei archaeon]